jgi:hypothetical protein
MMKLLVIALQAMKLFSHEKIYFEKLVKCAMLSLSSAGGSDCGASVSSAFVGWVLQKDGIKQARKMYKRYEINGPSVISFAMVMLSCHAHYMSEMSNWHF